MIWFQRELLDESWIQILEVDSVVVLSASSQVVYVDADDLAVALQ